MIITEDEIRQEVLNSIAQNRVMLFMKGTPERPMCGFSMRVTQALRDVDADFAAMDILPDPRIRQVLSARSGWPTIPQLFVNGELVGGCDITLELHESGELAKIAVPTLILVGDRDQFCSVEEGAQAYRSLEKGELAVLPGTGHLITPLAVQVAIEFLERQLAQAA